LYPSKVERHFPTTFKQARLTMRNPLANLTVGKGIGIATATMVALAFITGDGIMSEEKEIRVAMVGNSLMYYNDLPRLLEAMSGGSLSQDSCLHGSASFKSHLLYGNGMFSKWDTGNSRIWNVSDADNYDAATEAYQEYMEAIYDHDDDDNGDDDSQQQNTYQLDTKYSHIYDFGACTVQQLLLGADERLVEKYGYMPYDDDYIENRRHHRRMQKDQNPTLKDSMIIRSNQLNHRGLEDADADDDTDDEQANYYANTDDSYNEDWPLTDDGRNPCLLSANYYFFKQSQYDEFNGGVPKWDYIILNDNSRGPCCTSPREEGLEMLEDVYVPWILKTGAVPIFMVTHAYWPSTRDMSGLTDIPTFMSLTYEGYKEYAEVIGKHLPEHQQPKLAPVGLAFLLIWEESPSVWEKLIHMDEIHLTPTGTFLEGLIVYATLYGRLPRPNVVLNGDLANLYSRARKMVPSEHMQEAYPTLEMARYLYHIAARILNGEFPKSFIHYSNGESVDFTATKIYNNN